MGKRIAKSNKQKRIKPVDPSFKGPAKEDKRSNRGPQDIDEQEVPRKMKELFQWKDNVIKKRKKTKKESDIVVELDKMEDDQPGMSKSLKKVPQKMSKKKTESDYQFFNRIQKVVDQQMSEVKMEVKYGIDETKDKDLLAEADGQTITKLTHKQQKRKLLMQKRKMKQQKLKEDNFDEYENLTDKVEFGEVAMQPPDLKFAPRLTKVKPTVQAGKRALLLKQLPTDVQQGLQFTGHNTNSSLSGKRKDLSMFQRSRLENERINAVNLYKEMKSVKNKEKVLQRNKELLK